MTLTRIKLERFTAFEKLDVELSPGINIFIGENGTGKTHLLKVAYAACSVRRDEDSFARLLLEHFLPYQGHLGRLVHRVRGGTRGFVEVYRGQDKLRASMSSRATVPKSVTVTGRVAWTRSPITAAFIPVKEMLANAPGFRSLYTGRIVHFERVYADVVDLAFLPVRRGKPEKIRSRLLRELQRAIEGRVIVKQETFFLKNKHGELEFTLLAEGMRKLALLWLLLQNGTLLGGSVLFWDEPEANLNPKKIGSLVEILLELQRMGVQILLATHDYVLLKEFDLRMKREDKVRFHALYRDEDGRVRHQRTEEFLAVHPNAISDTFANLYNRDVKRALKVK